MSQARALCNNRPNAVSLRLYNSGISFALPVTNLSKSNASLGTLFSAPLPLLWILLDSQSTVSVFGNEAMLSDIYKAATPTRIHFNRGSMDFILKQT